MKKTNMERFGVFVILFTIISFFNLTGIAQQFDPNSPYQFVHDNKNSDVYVSINFIDTTTKQILNTFSLLENNPFNNLDYTELEKSDYGQPNIRYNLDGIPLNEININGNKIVLRSSLDLTTPKLDIVGWNFYYATISGVYLVVHYLFYINDDDFVLGRSDEIIIFNKKGEILHKLKDFDTNVREWALTENGRYFSYAYGGVLDESLNYFSTVGYKVIDLEEDKIVYAEDFGYEYNEVRTGSKNNLIAVTGFSLDYYYIFLDFSKKRKYIRTFTNKELGLWKEITNEGLMLYQEDRNSNSFRLLQFESDFKVEDIR
ncbi:MAG: hypothetical protein K9G61_01545 [Bacteroidales bacterium]|nr:hypothetical protein [Bacteroidales bacterium]